MEYGVNEKKFGRIALVAIDRDFAKQPRIISEVATFANYMIDGYGGRNVSGVERFYHFSRPRSTIRKALYLIGGAFPRFRIKFESYIFRSLAKKIGSIPYRFIIAHQIEDGLVALQSGLPFIFHSHEYLPRQFDGSLLFKLTEIKYRYLALERILPKAAAIIVEGEAVAKEYAINFDIPAARFIVMPNMPEYHADFECASPARAAVKLIHHGLLVPERGMDLLIDMAILLGAGYHLTLMGPGSGEYLKSLRKRAEVAKNVEILNPVPYDRIVESLHLYDIGLVVFDSPHFHTKHMTVPNKFWECLQARVPVLVSPESAMAEYILQSGCGVVSDSTTLESYVAAISKLSPDDIGALKTRCEALAWTHSRNSWMMSVRESVERSVDGTWNSTLDIG
jgi:glycosyltransferase involved in cell wall biosynthesis